MVGPYAFDGHNRCCQGMTTVGRFGAMASAIISSSGRVDYEKKSKKQVAADIIDELSKRL